MAKAQNAGDRSVRNRQLIVGVAALTACGLAGAALVAGGSPSRSVTPMCKGPLTGRTLSVTSNFGVVQKQAPLPLLSGEYVLTLDDGPNRSTTLANLATLRRYCVNATFMLIGRNADAAPDLARAVLAQGHGVGSHGYKHDDYRGMTDAAIEADFARGVSAVAGATGVSPRLMRMPGSPGIPLTPPASWLAFLKGKHLLLAGYDHSPQDWRNDPPSVTFHRMFDTLPDRGVLLMHDGQSNTVLLLPMVLDELRRRHAKIVALQTGLGD